MKKKLVAYLLVSALALTVFAGCSKKGGDADAAADAAVETEAEAPEAETPEAETPEAEAPEAEAAGTEAVEAEAPAEAVTAAAAVEEVGAEAAATVAEAAAETEDVKEFVDDEPAADAAATGEAAAPTEEVEDLIVDPGTEYTVRFGGNVYASMDENDANIIDYVHPGWTLIINERLENYWYNVSYYITGEGYRSGYIKIQ